MGKNLTKFSKGRHNGAAPMLASGMCTDVFQFDVSAAAASGAIVPATSVGNITAGNGHNSSYITTVKNRRVLYGLPTPLSGSNTNITKEQGGRGHCWCGRDDGWKIVLKDICGGFTRQRQVRDLLLYASPEGS
ncbi:basic-leucine zipper domain-containing protein [Artemisia annua]|uniref:Basic-leucine zipper domain-containing protein n=1 Tax=Artemisia annua TaxID=35608 RepID=A0A2U1P7F2_ARTAN|nr:basic-leucine zipper domain-containing protein [Artemisia annua]